jgi:hypothetical protein
MPGQSHRDVRFVLDALCSKCCALYESLLPRRLV